MDSKKLGRDSRLDTERRGLSRTLSCLGIAMLTFLAVARCLSFAINMVQWSIVDRNVIMTGIERQILNLLVYSISLLLPIRILAGALDWNDHPMVPMSAPKLRFLFPALGITLGVAAGVNVVSSVLLYYLQQMLGITLPAYAPSFSGDPLSLALTILSSAVAPAILEEIFFRGAIMQSLRPYGDGFAVVVSAVLFAICHTTVGQWLPALVIGLCLGCFVIRSGSVLTAMVIHFVYNLMVTLVSITGSRQGADGQLLGTLLMLCVSLAACLVSYRILSRQYGAIFRLRDVSNLSLGRRAVSVLTSLPVVLAAAMLIYTTIVGLGGG